MARWGSIVGVSALALAGLGAGTGIGTSSAAQGTPGVIRPVPALSASISPDRPVPMLPRLHPELSDDPQGLARAKAAAARYAASRGSAGTEQPSAAAAPVATRSWLGIRQTQSQPSDSTGAIGTTRYIEMINTNFAIYNRTSNTPISTGTLLGLAGCATTTCADNVFDPQVLWDGQTSRFYYVMDNILVSGSDNRLNFGFSKTASPNSAADWCKYNLGYGSTFPDYPKLGDTSNFAVIGVNDYVGNPLTYAGSDIVAISKPATGSTCPSASTFLVGSASDIRVQGGAARAFTPVPATQTDASSTGYAIARPAGFTSSGGTFLTQFKITRNATTGAPVITRVGTNVPVPAYKVPANVPQPGSPSLLDSSDTRPTQAVSAINPNLGKLGLWTQHTVLGGAGAEVRWYEINPAAHSLLASGKVTSATLYRFNGAVSPDRKVNGATKAFGGNMVLSFNEGNGSTRVGIYVVSKRGAAAQSTPVLVKLSTGIDGGFGSGCGSECRWGDYAAATPDPAAPTTNPSGAVWGTSMWNGPANPTGANWQTWNFAYRP